MPVIEYYYVYCFSGNVAKYASEDTVLEGIFFIISLTKYRFYIYTSKIPFHVSLIKF